MATPATVQATMEQPASSSPETAPAPTPAPSPTTASTSASTPAVEALKAISGWSFGVFAPKSSSKTPEDNVAEAEAATVQESASEPEEADKPTETEHKGEDQQPPEQQFETQSEAQPEQEVQPTQEAETKQEAQPEQKQEDVKAEAEEQAQAEAKPQVQEAQAESKEQVASEEQATPEGQAQPEQPAKPEEQSESMGVAKPEEQPQQEAQGERAAQSEHNEQQPQPQPKKDKGKQKEEEPSSSKGEDKGKLKVTTPSPKPATKKGRSRKASRRVSFSPSVEADDDGHAKATNIPTSQSCIDLSYSQDRPALSPRRSSLECLRSFDMAGEEDKASKGGRLRKPLWRGRGYKRPHSQPPPPREQPETTTTPQAEPTATKSTPKAKPKRLSINLDGIQLTRKSAMAAASGTAKPSTGVNKSNVMANRHAKVLERLINVQSSGLILDGGLTAPSGAGAANGGKKRFSMGKKTPGVNTAAPRDISPKQVKELKKALANMKLANGIIAELRAMDMAPTASSSFASNPLDPPTSPAQEALKQVVSDDDKSAQAQAQRPPSGRPLKAVCLSHPESEAMERHQEASKNASNDDTPSNGPVPVSSMPQAPTIMGVDAINLITSPQGALTSAGLDAVGVFKALGNASGAAIKASGTDADLHPPLDRMAIFTFWWGFEITLPKPSMTYLSTAHSVSGAFLNFLSTMVVSGGVPELLPFVKYLSMAFDLEYKAIQGADQGNGVVLAATWVMPFALVPRSWDYSLKAPSAPPSAPAAPSAPDAPSSGTGSETKAATSSKTVAPASIPARSTSTQQSAALKSGSSSSDSTKAEQYQEKFPTDMTATGRRASSSLTGTPRPSIMLESLQEMPEGSIGRKSVVSVTA